MELPEGVRADRGQWEETRVVTWEDGCAQALLPPALCCPEAPWEVCCLPHWTGEDPCMCLETAEVPGPDLMPELCKLEIASSENLLSLASAPEPGIEGLLSARALEFLGLCAILPFLDF